jgi:hypothetical protein
MAHLYGVKWCAMNAHPTDFWLRHEVPMNMAEEERASVSFNYEWG